MKILICEGRPLQYSRDLERLDEIMEELEIRYKIKEIHEEKRVKSYDESCNLYICKNNKLEIWI